MKQQAHPVVLRSKREPVPRAPVVTGIVAAAMAPKTEKRKPGKTLAPVKIAEQITISGGFSKKQFVIHTREFQFDGVAVACVPISNQEAWLCEMATDSPVYQRPMSRVRILQTLKDQLGAAAQADVVDDKMGDLAFDDDGPELELTPRTPVKGPGPRKRCAKGASASTLVEHTDPDVARLLEMPGKPSVTKPTVQVQAAYGDKKLYIALQSLPWLIQYIAEEKASGGVAPVALRGDDHNEKSGVHWNARDNVWQARFRRDDGSWSTKTKSVHARMKCESDPLFGVDYEVAKKVVYDELDKWLNTQKAVTSVLPESQH